MNGDRRVVASKPERKRRDVAGLVTPPPVVVTIERTPPEARVVDVVLIAADEDGDRPL